MLLEHYYGLDLKTYPDVLDDKLLSFLLRFQNGMMMRMSNIDEMDSSYFLMENDLRILLGSGPVDFTKLDDTTSNVSDYIVNDGDVIIIPRKESTVEVFGQVAEPGKVNYVEGKNYEYYIKEAGGKGEYARDDIMLIKAVTREWIPIDDDRAVIEEGDYIYVPRTLAKSFIYYVKTTSIFLSIVGSLATIALLVVNLTK